VHIQGKERPAIAITPERVIGSGGDLKDPRGIGVDTQGNVYVGDRGHGRIVVYSSDGEKLREWRSPPTDEDLPGIRDLDVAGDGTVYVLDAAGRVEVFTSEGERLRTIETGELGLYSPNGIAAEVGGVLIADTGNNRVARLSFTGDRMAVTLFKAESGGGLNQPFDVAMRAGQLYALDLDKRVVRLSESDLLLDRWQLMEGEHGGSLLAVSPDGTAVYVADPNGKRVAMLDMSTGDVTYHGAKGQFSGPSGIAAGPDGRVYVLDRNGSVQIFPPRMRE
jgi:DNA-binding beta-propeller fold protein YncE